MQSLGPTPHRMSSKTPKDSPNSTMTKNRTIKKCVVQKGKKRNVVVMAQVNLEREDMTESKPFNHLQVYTSNKKSSRKQGKMAINRLKYLKSIKQL